MSLSVKLGGILAGVAAIFVLIALALGPGIVSGPSVVPPDTLGGASKPSSPPTPAADPKVIDPVVEAGAESAPAGALPSTLPPVDDGAQETAFANVRDALRRAVVSRDVPGVLAHTASDVRVSFGDGATAEDFRKWLTDEETSEAFWFSLDDVLQFGAVRTGTDSFCMPYFVCGDLTTRLGATDLYNTGVLVRADVEVREAPDEQSAIIGTLSYAVVELGSYLDDPTWMEIRIPESGREGYVERSYVRLPTGFRADFEKRPEGWKLASFRSGNGY